MFTEAEVIESMQFSFLFGKTINSTGSAREEITYQYAGTSQPVDFGGGDRTGWTSFTAAEEAKFEEALAHIETFLNVDFVEVTGDSDPDLNVGKVDFFDSTAGLGGLSASFIGTTVTRVDSFVIYKNTLDLQSELSLILHELGHSLGLKHPFDSPVVPAGTDSNKYTVMSYTTNPDNGLDNDGMGLFDVVALQSLWGAADFKAGNSTYTGSRNSTVDTIWDTGGTDHFNASAKASNVVLDLREGHFSIFNTIEDVVIAFGTEIENATGGSGADTITGNALDNKLVGGSGNDTIKGNGGADILNGEDGKDKLVAGLGIDALIGGKGNDILLGGNGNDNLKGGSGRDKLEGGGGKDILKGGIGSDKFVFKNSFGKDKVKDFQDDIDILKIGHADVSSVDDALSFANNVGDNVVFLFDDGAKITVLDMTMADLTDDILII